MLPLILPSHIPLTHAHTSCCSNNHERCTSRVCATPSSWQAAKLSQEARFPGMVPVCHRLQCQIILRFGIPRWARDPCQRGAASLRPGLLRRKSSCLLRSVLISHAPRLQTHTARGDECQAEELLMLSAEESENAATLQQPRSYRHGQDQARRSIT